MAETQLTLAARALGFDESAKSVDLLAQAQARLVENQKELEEARSGGTIDDVARLAQEQKNLTFVVDSLGQKQGEVTAGERDWMGVLRRLSPQIAGFIDGLTKSAKVTKDLADQKKLLSSVGAAVIPIVVAIAAAVRAMAAEFAEANKTIRDQAKALDELASKQRERQQSIEDIRAASKLPVFTPDEARAAAVTAGRIGEQFPFIDQGAVNRAVAFGAGLFGMDQTARLARLIQLGPESLKLTEQMRPAAVQREINNELKRHRARLDQDFATEAAQSAEGKARVSGEIAQMGGSTLNLRERIAARALEGMDIDKLVELAQKVEDMGGLEELDRLLQMAISGESPSLHVLRRINQGGGVFGANLGFLDPTHGATEAEIAVLRGVFQGMRPIDARQYNGRYIGADAAAQEAREITGASKVRNVEGW